MLAVAVAVRLISAAALRRVTLEARSFGGKFFCDVVFLRTSHAVQRGGAAARLSSLSN